MKEIFEARDLNVYKKLLRVLGGYSDAFPATGVSKLFRKLLTVGLKAIPKDEHALSILNWVLGGSVPAAVQQLLNVRFSDLPFELRPMYKAEKNSKEVAFWENDGVIVDKVVGLIDFDGKVKVKRWVDVSGKPVGLIGLEEEGGKG